MVKGPLDYGRYPDGHIGCPRAQSDMTPCIARDGKLALADDRKCVGCGATPTVLNRELREAMGLTHVGGVQSADETRDLVTLITRDLQ